MVWTHIRWLPPWRALRGFPNRLWDAVQSAHRKRTIWVRFRQLVAAWRTATHGYRSGSQNESAGDSAFFERSNARNEDTAPGREDGVQAIHRPLKAHQTFMRKR